MKIELESQDIQAIADAVIERIKPLLSQEDKSNNVLLNKKELSQLLKVDVSWIDKNLYRIPHVKMGRYIRFKLSQINKWLLSIEKPPSNYIRLIKNSK